MKKRLSYLLTAGIFLSAMTLPAYAAEAKGIEIHSERSWSDADRFGKRDTSLARAKTGYVESYYQMKHADGSISALMIEEEVVFEGYSASGEFKQKFGDVLYLERYDALGNLIGSKTLGQELHIMGTFLACEDGFYVAYGDYNGEKDDTKEVWRIVKYDLDGNRLGSASASGGETYTVQPFRSAVARMTLSEDGKTLVLYAARTRYDGHQSNITFFLDTDTMTWKSIWGEEFPSNHVSHSFGQFVRFDGDELVTVDHGDAYPRSFVLQTSKFTTDLWGIDGEIGENVTNAIGSGFEVSEDGYLFLGCSDPQTGDGGAWNVFLTFTDRGGVIPQSLTFGSVTVSTEKPTGGYWSLRTGGKTYYATGCKSGEELEEAVRAFEEATSSDPNCTWLTQSDTTINCARLVKIDGNTFVAMWAEGKDLHWQVLNGLGVRQGEERILSDVPMPPNEPLVEGRYIRWIQEYNKVPTLFTLDIDTAALVLPQTAETVPELPAMPQVATPTGNLLLVDGVEKLPAAYMINDNNYFKLRDVAALLNGTQAQFSIGWDGVTGAITIQTGEAYTPLGTELQGKPTDTATAQASQSAIYINGVKADLTAYLINDNNYFKLRDLGKALGFNVSWDGTTGAVLIESDQPYDER